MPKAGWKKNPETGSFEPPVEGEVAEAAPRKRHDPGEGPVDGVYRNDHVVNKDPSKRYYLLDEDDALTKQAQGARMVERRAGAARPFFDRGSDADSGYRVKGLTLYEMPEALAKKHDAEPVADAARTLATIRQDARQRGGVFEFETNPAFA